MKPPKVEIIKQPVSTDQRCSCGHTREQHAWGINQCEDVYPYRICELKCHKFRQVR